MKVLDIKRVVIVISDKGRRREENIAKLDGRAI